MRAHRRIVLIIALVALAAGVKWAYAQRPAPSRADIARIREELRQRQAEREAAAKQHRLVAWQALPASPPAGRTPDGFAAIRIRQEMDSLRAVCVFQPGARNDAETVRVPLPATGEYWMALPGGEWGIELTVGDQAGADWLALAPREVDIDAGSSYQLELTEDVERALKELLRRQAADRKRASDAPPELTEE